MTREPKLTPTQRRLMEVLKDQQPHPRKDLEPCLTDGEYATTPEALQMAISRLRTAIRPVGMEVYSRYDHKAKQLMYRLVSLVVLQGHTIERI